MLRYIIKRVFEIIPTLFIVVTIAFFLTRVIPGDPVIALCGNQASPEVIERVTQEMGFDQPMIIQYKNYLLQILSGDFGTSFAYNRSVMSLLAEKLPYTLQLSLLALAIALVIGVLIGTYSAMRQYSIGDYIFTFFALIGISIPTFWLALMLVLIFSVNLNWLPAFGAGNVNLGIWDVFSHMILPVAVLTLSPLTRFTRITRSSMLEVINKDYIKALRARGISRFNIIYKHGLKNALPPIVTVLGMQMAVAFTGAVLTESIFSWPGMGSLIIGAIENRDYALIQGSVLFIALIYVLINLMVDVLYLVINPKHRSSVGS